MSKVTIYEEIRHKQYIFTAVRIYNLIKSNVLSKSKSAEVLCTTCAEQVSTVPATARFLPVNAVRLHSCSRPDKTGDYAYAMSVCSAS